MADTKITSLLTPQVTTNPATDVLPIVNIADTLMASSGSTRKITVNQLLGAGGTATLASATITGDLTVDTNVLKVDTTNNRVGILTATPAYPLSVAGRISYSGAIGEGADTTVSSSGTSLLFGNSATWSETQFFAGGNLQYRVQSSGVFTWLDGAGGTRMTLNSTGLGVGVASPTAKLHISGNFKIDGATSEILMATGSERTISASGSTSSTALTFKRWNGSSYVSDVVMDGSGNVGVGVTPSAWQSGYTVIDLKGGPSLFTNSSISAPTIASNWFINSSAQSVYKANGFASYYTQYNSAHTWGIAATGLAGALINGTGNFTTAMTLDASGNLLVGTTSALSAWATRLTLSTDAGTTKWAVGPYADATNFIISASGSFGVYLNGTSAVSWTGISDERLKDIIEPISNAVAKVGSLRAVIGKFKADETNTRRSFLLAQDVQAVLPEAVDASNPDRLGVAYTDVIPLLVAAIKELSAEVNALKNA